MSSAIRTWLASGVALFLSAASVSGADLSGTWALEFQRSGSQNAYQGDCTFQQEGDRLSGSCLSGFESIVPVRGTVKGTAVTFQFTTGAGGGSTATFTGQLDERETSMKGTWRFVDPEGNEGGGTFTATKR